MANIEHDRRSAVSSFYGGRRSSVDMLNSEPVRQASPTMRGVDVASQRSRRGGPDRDDASSFFSPQLQSQNAGYNRQSFFDAGRSAPVKGGRDEEEAAFIGGNPGQQGGWDVFADFNNTGPRYSNAFVKYDEGYQRLPPDTHSVSTPPAKYEEEASAGPVEMVTVPALGAEWRKAELKSMTKAGRREQNSGKGVQWKRWWRDQEGICGRFGTRKQIAIIAFVIAAIIAIVVAFTLPRVPGFAFESTSPLRNATDGTTPEFSRFPANFSFDANLDLQVDTSSNFLPLKFSTLSAELFDLQTENLVATGNLTGKTVPAKKFTEILVPLNFSYVALNDSDPTWNNWYNACKNTALYANGSRPGVDFRIELTMKIAGLIGSHKAATQISNVNCPIELPQNSV